jgi:hypothetical protein
MSGTQLRRNRGPHAFVRRSSSPVSIDDDRDDHDERDQPRGIEGPKISCVNPITSRLCRTQRACRFSPSTMIRSGPSFSERAFPSRLSARITTRSVNAWSNSASAKTARYESAASTRTYVVNWSPRSFSPDGPPTREGMSASVFERRLRTMVGDRHCRARQRRNVRDG